MIDLSSLNLSSRETLFQSLPSALKIAEVGVLNGEFSAVIRKSGPCELWLIDCWIAPPGYPVDEVTLSQINADYFRAYLGVLGKFCGYSEVSVIRAFSTEAAIHFSNGYFDVVYIDADHWDCANDIRFWWPKVKSGGLLAGHDYLDKPTDQEPNGVKRDVDSFITNSGLHLHLTQETISSWVIQKP